MILYDSDYVDRLNRQYNAGKFLKAVILTEDPLFYQNLLFWGQNLENSSWQKINSSVIADAFFATDKIVEDSSSGVSHHIQQQQTATVDSDGTFTLSCYAKADTRSWIMLQLSNDIITNGFRCFFDVSNGIVGTPGIFGTGEDISASMEFDATFNLWRCRVTGTIPGASALNAVIALSTGDGTITYNGDGSSGLYVWAMQLEEAASVGPRIITSGARAYAPLNRYWVDHEESIVFNGNTYQPLHMKWENIKTSQGMPTEGANVSVSNLGNQVVRYLKDLDISGNTVILQLLNIDLLSIVTGFWRRQFTILSVSADQSLAVFSVGRSLGRNKLPRKVYLRSEWKGLTSDVARIL